MVFRFLTFCFILYSFIGYSQGSSSNKPSTGVNLAWGPVFGATFSNQKFTKADEFVTIYLPDRGTIAGYADVSWLVGSEFKSQSFHFGMFFEIKATKLIWFGVEPSYGKYSWTSEVGIIEADPIEVPIYVRINFIYNKPVVPWIRLGIANSIGGKPTFEFNREVEITKISSGAELVPVTYYYQEHNHAGLLLGVGCDFRLAPKLFVTIIYNKTIKLLPYLSNSLVHSSSSFNNISIRFGIKNRASS